MAVNPSVTVGFRDGQLRPSINLAEEICLKIGVATDGPYNVPLRCSSLNSVLRFRHGPVVRSAAPHVDYSGVCYVMRCKASINGSIGSATKTPGPNVVASAGSLSLSLMSYSLHTQVADGAALDVSTGWVKPGAPMRMKITVGAGAVAHTQTVTYINSAGDTVSEDVAVTAAGSFYTTGDVAQVIRVVTNVDPQGTCDYDCVFTSPADRYNMRLECVTGGVLGVTGGTTPVCRLSLDGGVTYGRNFSLASDGVKEILTYAGGLTAQATGQKATVSAGSISQVNYGAIRVAGATTPGDIVYNLKVSGVTVTHVVGAGDATRSIAVVGTAITVTPARTGGVVDGTETANAIVTALLADAGAAALVTPVAVGAGTGLLAAAASAGAANGGLTVTERVEGVRFRVVNGGASQSRSVSVSGKDVTFYVDTDANGAQTTTASTAETAIMANSSAAALLLVDATGTGATIVGALGSWLTLAPSVATGDYWTWTTTPPKWSNADLAESIAALLRNERALSAFSVAHIVGESTDTDNVTMAGFVTSAASTKRQYKTVVAEGTYMGSTAETTWANTLKSDFATKSPYVGLCAGEVNTVNSAYGTVDRMNCATPYVARLMICPISELPSHVDCVTILGTKNALDGTIVRSNDGDMPLWQTEDTLADLNLNNFVTLRTHPGRTGIYVRQGLQFTTDGSSFTFVTNRRIANVAAALAYDEGLRFLNDNLLIDPVTGELAELECQKLEAQIGGRLRKKLVGSDRGRQHCSAVSFTVARGENFGGPGGTGNVTGSVNIVPRVPITSFSIDVGFDPVTL